MTKNSQVKKYYFVGIAGMGMSALARMLHQKGHVVAGSNIESSELMDTLSGEGITTQVGQGIDMIPNDVDTIVYSQAVADFHPEFISEIRDTISASVFSYPEMLGEISKDTYTIAIAGTHGKTTTTGMVGSMLIDAEKKPSVIVGSILAREQSNYVAGSSDIFVIEACEYKRSFLHLNPDILVITNIEADHLDYYGTVDNVYTAFGELVARVADDGCVISSLPSDIHEKVIGDSQVQTINYNTYYDDTLNLRIPAPYNFQNAAAALAVGDYMNIPREVAIKSLEELQGTWRRFQYIGQHTSGALVYNDYAHHPTELRAVLAGARHMFEGKKIIAVFEPHLYSRTKALFSEFASSFADADQVYVTPVYHAREQDDGSISSQDLVKAIQVTGTSAHYVDSYDAAHIAINEHIDADTMVLVLGAGPVYRLAQTLVS